MAAPPAVLRVFALLLLATSAAKTQRPDSATSVLLGRITDSVGTGLSGAEVGLFGAKDVHTFTNDTGGFRLDALPSGANVFTVRRLGYEPITFTAVLKAGKMARTTVSLAANPELLPKVDVSDTAATHWLDAFNRRKSNHEGVFFTRDDIVKAGARRGTDMARHVAGVHLQETFTGYQVIVDRGGPGGARRTCIPSYYVHNVQYSGTLDDFPADEIEALEFYIGVSEIPPELQRAGKINCAAVVIWTRDPRVKPGG